eukprot:2124847-Pyramimonas_sp.AAC.1
MSDGDGGGFEQWGVAIAAPGTPQSSASSAAFQAWESAAAQPATPQSCPSSSPFGRWRSSLAADDAPAEPRRDVQSSGVSLDAVLLDRGHGLPRGRPNAFLQDARAEVAGE